MYHFLIALTCYLEQATHMALIEEHWISGERLRGLAHVRLTSTTFTFSAILMRWVMAKIPVTTIREVQLDHHFFRDRVIIQYGDSPRAFRTISFSTSQLERWGAAFQRLGVKVVARR
jgi:hypothetical protein